MGLAAAERLSGTLSSAYLVSYYAAGAIGTAIAGILVSTVGWRVLALIATTAVAVACIVVAVPTRSGPQISTGTHRRGVVDRNRFLARLA